MLTERGKRALAAYTAVTTELDLGSLIAENVEEKELRPEIKEVPRISMND